MCCARIPDLHAGSLSLLRVSRYSFLHAATTTCTSLGCHALCDLYAVSGHGKPPWCAKERVTPGSLADGVWCSQRGVVSAWRVRTCALSVHCVVQSQHVVATLWQLPCLLTGTYHSVQCVCACRWLSRMWCCVAPQPRHQVAVLGRHLQWSLPPWARHPPPAIGHPLPAWAPTEWCHWVRWGHPIYILHAYLDGREWFCLCSTPSS